MGVQWRVLRPVAGLLAILLMLTGICAMPSGLHAAADPPAPLLLITSSGAPNHFGAYLGEILRAEGVMSFDTSDIATITATALQSYPIVLLAEMPLQPAATDLFKSYVAAGGRLIAMRPDAGLDELCGWPGATGTIDGGYVGIATDKPAGAGLPAARLQIHGAAALHASGDQAVAALYQAANGDPVGAAVTLAPQSGGGATACWAYDLATSVALTRQGNPANADVDVDGDGVFRTIDLFQTKGGGAPWVDRDRLAVPQADEQMRLLGRIIEDFSADAAPLPRLWYFPDGAMTMLILTGDAHANPLSYYEKELNSLNSHGGKITLYLSAAGDPSDVVVQRWRKQGHEVGIHPYASKPDPSPSQNISNLAQGYDLFATWFANSFKSPMSRTVRNHQVAWKGWTDAAEIAVSHHIALDTDFYHWGAWLKQSDGAWPHGYITGSGQPMKFVRADGTLLPIYQQLTELVDEQLIKQVGFAYEGLSGSQALNVSRQMIDASLAGDYAALMTQFHVDTYGFGDPQEWAEGTLDYARGKGVPIWNADQWLNFTEMRHNAQLSGLSWAPSSGRLSFKVQSSGTTTHTLTLMLPASAMMGALSSTTIDSTPQTMSIRTIKGRQYAFLAIAPGDHQIEASYAVKPSTGLQSDQSISGSLVSAAERAFKQVGIALSSSNAGSKVAIIAVLLFGLALVVGVGMRVANGRARPSPHSKVSGRSRAVPIPQSVSSERRPGRVSDLFAPLRSLVAGRRPTTRSNRTRRPAIFAHFRLRLPGQRIQPRPLKSALLALSTRLRPTLRIRRPLGRASKRSIKFCTTHDFSSFGAAVPVCTNTVVTEDAGGAISLKAKLEDYFHASQLNRQLWVTGYCLIGMPEIRIANDSLQITSTLTGGGFVRSISGQHYGSLEGHIGFGLGDDQQFGWATAEFARDQYAIFCTGEIDNALYVCTHNMGDEQLTAVGRNTGAQHLRIEWADAGNAHDTFRYYVNRKLVATHIIPALPPLYVHLWNNTLGRRTVTAGWVRATPYAANTGTYLSCPIFVQADKKQVWGPVDIDTSTPPGTSITIEVRTSNDRVCWSEFVPVSRGGIPAVPAGVFLQYRAVLDTADHMIAPTLNAISIGYRAFTLPPQVCPRRAPRGTQFMIKGSGFNSEKPLNVIHAGRSLGSLSANEFGELSFFLDSTNAIPGTHRIAVSEPGRANTTLTFTITEGNAADPKPAAHDLPTFVIGSYRDL